MNYERLFHEDIPDDYISQVFDVMTGHSILSGAHKRRLMGHFSRTTNHRVMHGSVTVEDKKHDYA